MISFGSSSQKITQNINQSFMKTILGATGFGLSYDTDLIIIQYGNYFYGTGANASGDDNETRPGENSPAGPFRNSCYTAKSLNSNWGIASDAAFV